MTLVGLEGDVKLLDELRRLAFEHAQRAVIINGTPFTENREELFHLLRRHSLAMMLSFHEGFGLIGWEAIAAGVPLVISQNSGVFELLDARVLENHVFSVDVRGAADPHMLNEEDIKAVAQQVLLIAGAPQRARARAQALARKLKSMFTWPQCAFQLATTASVPVQQSPFRLLLAAGHPAIDVCGPSDASAGGAVRGSAQSADPVGAGGLAPRTVCRHSAPLSLSSAVRWRRRWDLRGGCRARPCRGPAPRLGRRDNHAQQVRR